MSSVSWEFEWYTEDGSRFISIEEWVSTLTEREQNEFQDAVTRQRKFRSDKIAEGNLIVRDSEYVWKNKEAEEVNKENDPIWLRYWDRWQVETKSRCRIIKKEI